MPLARVVERRSNGHTCKKEKEAGRIILSLLLVFR